MLQDKWHAGQEHPGDALGPSGDGLRASPCLALIPPRQRERKMCLNCVRIAERIGCEQAAGGLGERGAPGTALVPQEEARGAPLGALRVL